MENRQSVVRKVTEFVASKYGNDWHRAFDAYAANGKVDRAAVIDVLDAAGAGTLIGRPFIASEVMQFLDTDGDGALTFEEFNAIAKVVPPPAPPAPPK